MQPRRVVAITLLLVLGSVAAGCLSARDDAAAAADAETLRALVDVPAQPDYVSRASNPGNAPGVRAMTNATFANTTYVIEAVGANVHGARDQPSLRIRLHKLDGERVLVPGIVEFEAQSREDPEREPFVARAEVRVTGTQPVLERTGPALDVRMADPLPFQPAGEYEVKLTVWLRSFILDDQGLRDGEPLTTTLTYNALVLAP